MAGSCQSLSGPRGLLLAPRGISALEAAVHKLMPQPGTRQASNYEQELSSQVYNDKLSGVLTDNAG